jgi:hypothetical protein
MKNRISSSFIRGGFTRRLESRATYFIVKGDGTMYMTFFCDCTWNLVGPGYSNVGAAMSMLEDARCPEAAVAYHPPFPGLAHGFLRVFGAIPV